MINLVSTLYFPFLFGLHLCKSTSSELNFEYSSYNSLSFVTIGDWGKGGLYGDIRTIQSYDENNNDNKLFLLSNNEEFDVQGNNNNNNNNKIYYTYQLAISEALGAWAEKNLPSFVVALGDNFYNYGVSSTTDSMWETHWKNVYIDKYPSLQVPWYSVLGNHDHGYGQTGVDAQIERVNSGLDDYWKTPATNYTKLFDIPGGGKLQIIFIETTTLAPSQNKCCNQNGGISVEVQTERIDNQLSYINSWLIESRDIIKPNWLLVMGHYPIYSSGEHSDMSELVSYIDPLLVEYNVDAYFSGHDHISEHLSKNGVEYFVAGSAALTSTLGKYGSAATLNWAYENYPAFATVSVSADILKVSYTDRFGELLYSHEIKKEIPSTPSPSSKSNIPPQPIDNGKPSILNMAFVGSISFASLTLILLVAVVISRSLSVRPKQVKSKNLKLDTFSEAKKSNNSSGPSSPAPPKYFKFNKPTGQKSPNAKPPNIIVKNRKSSMNNNFKLNDQPSPEKTYFKNTQINKTKQNDGKIKKFASKTKLNQINNKNNKVITPTNIDGKLNSIFSNPWRSILSDIFSKKSPKQIPNKVNVFLKNKSKFKTNASNNLHLDNDIESFLDEEIAFMRGRSNSF